MTVMLESKPEVENRVTKKAKSLGKTVENFLLEVMEENLYEERQSKPFYETATDEKWIAELDSLTVFSDKMPKTWDDSRESIYREREDAQI